MSDNHKKRHDHPAHPSAAGEAAGRAVEPGADVPPRPAFPETHEIPAPGMPISAAEFQRLKDAAARPDADQDDTTTVQEDQEEGC